MTAALLPRAPFGAVARLAWRPAAPSMTALAGSFAGAVSSDLESLEHCIVQADGEDGVRECIELFDLESGGDEPLTALERCIIDADGEGDVALCIEQYDAAAAEDGTQELSGASPLEECIVHADGEDGVRECMERFDALQGGGDRDPPTPLELCILAAKSEDEVQECMELLA